MSHEKKKRGPLLSMKHPPFFHMDDYSRLGSVSLGGIIRYPQQPRALFFIAKTWQVQKKNNETQRFFKVTPCTHEGGKGNLLHLLRIRMVFGYLIFFPMNFLKSIPWVDFPKNPHLEPYYPPLMKDPHIP